MATGGFSKVLRRALSIGGACVAIVLLALGVFRGLTTDLRASDGDREPEYQTLPVLRGSLDETVVATGTIEPLVRVPVIAEVSGIIATVHVQEGDRVEKGQPLFELDRERLDARVAERRAELELRQAQASFALVARAEVLHDRARRDRERIAELHRRQVASALDLERADEQLRLASISVQDARAETASRLAAVAQARETLRQAERDLRNAVVRAPIDGVVIERAGEIGRAVADVTSSGGTVIAVIADDRRLRLLAEVDENDISRIHVGLAANVHVDALLDESFKGRVRKISAAGTVESKVSNFEVEIEIEPDERLRVGMSCDARVVVGEHQDVLTIPNNAIVRVDGATHVRVLDVGGGPAHRLAPVRLGSSDGFRSIVAEGLSAGDVILVRAEETRG